MGKPLQQAEYWIKWIAAIGILFGTIKLMWNNILKTYKYIQECVVLLETIKNNMEYSKIERQAIMNKINLGYFTSDLQGKTIEVGDLVCKIFGYPESDLLSFGWSSFIFDEDKKRVMRTILEDIKYERNGDLKYRIVTATGEIKSVHVTTRRTSDRYFCTLEVIK